MSATGVLILAWMLGVMCGVAVSQSWRYKVALTFYLFCIVVLQSTGVKASPFLLDLLLSVFGILLCFGVALGVVGLVWERKDRGDGISTGRNGHVQVGAATVGTASGGKVQGKGGGKTGR